MALLTGTEVSAPPKRLVAGVIAGGSLAIMDATIVVPTVGQIASDFNAGSEATLVVSIYLIATSVTMPLWGRLLDVRGERTAYLAAMAFFAVGTVLALFAPSLPVLIAARLIQGIGGGGLSPLGQAILAGRCTPVQRARLQIWYTIFYGVFAAIGPTLGSVALASGTWRTSFVILLVLTPIPALLLWGKLRAYEGTSHRSLDINGAFWLATSLLMLIVGLKMTEPNPQLLTWILLVGGLLALWVFYRHASRTADPILSLKIVTHRVMGSCALVALLNGFTIFGFMTYLPMTALHLGTGAWFAGFVVIPLTAGWTVLSAASSRLSLVVGNRLLLWLAGPLVAAAGLLVVAAGSADPELVKIELLAASTCAGLAAGLVAVPNMLLAQRHAPATDVGSTTSLIMFMRNFGGTLGVAAVSAVALLISDSLSEGLTTAFLIFCLVGAAQVLISTLLPTRRSELADLARHLPNTPRA